MSKPGSESVSPMATPSIRWNDSDVQEQRTEDDIDDETGFLARQKRRISEHPKISQIHLARRTSKHSISFLRKALGIIASSLIFKIVFACLRLIPISKIVVFGIYYNQCPVEPLIPIYLLVGGVAACARDLAGLLTNCCFGEKCINEYEIMLTLIAFFYTIAEFVWFILGSIYVYKTFDLYQGKDDSKPGYCHDVLYLYSFGVTTLSYFLLFLVVSLSCCTMFLVNITETKPPRKQFTRPPEPEPEPEE